MLKGNVTKGEISDNGAAKYLPSRESRKKSWKKASCYNPPFLLTFMKPRKLLGVLDLQHFLLKPNLVLFFFNEVQGPSFAPQKDNREDCS